MDSGEAADKGVEMTSKVPVAPAGGAAAAPAGDGARVSPFPHLAAVRSQLRPWHVRFSLQMQALVEKNLIIAKRHWKVTVLQVRRFGSREAAANSISRFGGPQAPP